MYDQQRDQFPIEAPLSPNPPWHMWGNTVRLFHNGGGNPDALAVIPQQVCRVNYKRPETWGFFFGARIANGSTQGPIPTAMGCQILFDVAIGIGRSAFLTKQPTPQAPLFLTDRGAFCRFVFAWNIGTDLLAQPGKWTTSVPGPLMEDFVATSGRSIEWIVAQDINCSVEMTLVGGSGVAVAIDASAYFAPRTHIRPDWELEARQNVKFRGDELGGT